MTAFASVLSALLPGALYQRSVAYDQLRRLQLVPTSGTYSNLFNTRRVIDRALGRCKLFPQQITSEKIDIARDNLYLLLSTLANKGVQLWCVEKLILPLYQAQANVYLPARTVDILNANLRMMTRLTGTDTSSASGTVSFAFDDDFETTCTQTSANGNIQTLFASETQVTTVGVLAGATDEWDLHVEVSDDASTWTEVLDIGAVSVEAGKWYWYDIDAAPSKLYWRLRTSDGTLAITELYWGNNPLEINLGRLNQDSYTALPNKTFPGQPLQFWFDRQRTEPPMQIWPVTDEANRYNQFTVWVQRYIQDVGALTEELDVPQRWYTAIVDELALQCGREFPEVPADLVANMEAFARRSWSEAQNEERDNSPLMIQPGVRVYTA